MLSSACLAQSVKKSPVDLLREGRILEAQQIIAESGAPERYQLLLDALREPNAIEACFIYREISARFPGTDCDEFAQERLLQAASMGIDISALVLEAAPGKSTGGPENFSPSAYEVERPLIAKSTRSNVERLDPSRQAREEQHSEQPDSLEAKSREATESGFTLDYNAKAAESVNELQAAGLKDEKKLTKPNAETDVPAALQQQEVTPDVQVLTEPTTPIDFDATDAGEWYIQVGAFGNHENANKFAEKLRKDGYRVELVPKDHLLQVRVGGYAKKEIARRIGDQIKAKHNCPAVLVTSP
ncbi:SPOR domain-containing protein [bacterium]|nr:SPOR domain-containing protein [bacterium]